MIRKYAEIFCWQNVSSFCSAKATHIFSAKNIRILCIESAKTVNEMTLNKLVKLMMLWTTGPWFWTQTRRYQFSDVDYLKNFHSEPALFFLYELLSVSFCSNDLLILIKSFLSQTLIISHSGIIFVSLYPISETVLSINAFRCSVC